jgi:hypothetical protein
MDQNKLAHAFATDPAANESDLPQLQGRTGDIRLLDELELALAGGGDTVVPWP